MVEMEPHMSIEVASAIDDVENDPHHSQLTTMDADQLASALKVARQYMILLEDYRYLLGCYQETCECHVNFDHQVFFRKLEDKLNILANISTNNPLLTNALDDNCDYETINQLWNDANKIPSTEKPETNQAPYIRRIRVSQKPLRHNHNTTTNNSLKEVVNNTNEDISTEQDMNDHSSVAAVVNQSHNTEPASSIKQAFKCNHAKCDFLTFNQDDIVKHYASHTGLEATVAGKRFDKNEVIYVCEHCGKEFSGQKWLENHIENVHAFVKVFSCDFPNCNYKSKFRCVIDDHRKRHDAMKEFKCTWEGCESEFVTKRDMLAHVNFYHKGIKNYTCTWKNCNASFKDSNRLRHHSFTHTGERPYKCTFSGCGASFKQMPHLHKHRRTHMNAGGGTLARRVNVGYVCPIEDCNDRFPDEEELNKHISLAHESVTQLYKCEIDGCARYFLSTEECKEHMKDHQEEDASMDEDV